MARRVTAGSGVFLLDSDGLSKIASDDERAWAHLKRALEEQSRVLAPAVILAEVLRGGPRDANVHRVLERVTVVDITAVIGRAAGEILGQVGGDKTVDAVVAAVAAAHPGRVGVLISDTGDIAALTEGRGDIRVIHV
ncbi:MAG: PIN domain-containing protein [Actinobacteria bacterium]|nr:PIN domain-containing protein [Actinomycetota bacterium]